MARLPRNAAAELHFRKMHERLKDSPKMDELALLGWSASFFAMKDKDQAFKLAEEAAR